MSKGGGTVTGYRYSFGIHMGLCHGPVDALLKIEVGGELAWPAVTTQQVGGGSVGYLDGDGNWVYSYDPPVYAEIPANPPVTESGSITINAPDLFGGDTAEGGIQGPLDVMMGEDTQPVNSNLASMLGGLVSAFRGMLTLFYDGLISSNNPYPKAWRFLVRRSQKGWDDDNCWYPEKASIPFTCPVAEEDGDPPPEESVKRLVFAETFEHGLTPYTDTGTNKENVLVSIEGGMQFRIHDYYVASSRTLSRDVRDIAAPGIPARAQVIEFQYNVTAPDDPEDLVGPGAFPFGGQAARIIFRDVSTGSPLDIVFYPMVGYSWDNLVDPPELVPTAPYVSLPKLLDGSESTWVTTGSDLGDLPHVAYWAGRVRITLTETVVTVSLVGETMDPDGKIVDVLFPSHTFTGVFPSPFSVSSLLLVGGNIFSDQRLPVKYSQVLIYDYVTDADADGSGGAMNPAHIIYECLTNVSWGRGLPAELIDTVSFAIAADTLYEEGFGLCLLWSQEDDILVFVQTVIDHIGAVLYPSRETGLVTLVLIRDDYVVNDLPVFTTQTGLLSISEDEATSSQELVNELVVSYVSPCDGSPKQVRVHNIGSMQAAGAIFSKSVSYPGIPTHELAARVAQRDLKVYGTPLRRFKLTLDRRAWQMAPGKVFVIQSTERNIGSLVLRAGEVTDGDAGGSTILVTAVQDIFGLPATSFVGEIPPPPTPDRTPKPVVVQAMYEAGYVDILRTMTPAEFAAVTIDDTFISLFGRAPSSFAINFTILSGVSGGLQSNNGVGGWSPHATVAADVGFTDTSIELSDVYRGSSIVLGSAARVDNEIVRVVSYNSDTGVLGVFRGCADTIPALHASGSRMWFIYAGGGYDSTRYAEGETVTAKLLTNTMSGNLSPALATGLGAVTINRQARPYPPASVYVNGDPYIDTPEMGLPITFTWAHRNRLAQADVLVAYDQPSITPEVGTTYTIRVKLDEVVLREITDITANTFEYTLGDWLGDGGEANLGFEIVSVRDEFECWQPAAFELAISSDAHLLAESSESVLIEASELIVLEEGDPPPPGTPPMALQSVLSQAVLDFVMIEAGVLYGQWWHDFSSFSEVHILGRDIASDTGTYMSPTLADSVATAVLYAGGGVFFVAGYDVDAYGGLVAAYIKRAEVGGSVVTWTAPADDLVQSLGWDGTYLWSYSIKDGALRKHTASTLVELSAFDIPDLGGINFGGEGAWAAGKMLVKSGGTNITCCDPALALPYIDWVVDIGVSVNRIFARGSLFFVVVPGGIKVLDSADGTILQSYSDGVYSEGEGISGASTDFAYRPTYSLVRWLSAVDGTVVRERSLAGTIGYYQGALDAVVITARYDFAAENTFTRIYDI